MANPSSAAKKEEPHVRLTSPLAALLSYLVPGLGQIYEGRVAKGVLFLVCLYGLFFYGMFLSCGTAVLEDGKKYTLTSNVYLPDSAGENNPWGLPKLVANLYNRPQFAGQFWMGVAAWPAIAQYLSYDKSDEEGHGIFGNFERTPSEKVVNDLQRNGDKRWDLAWVYTVIAGVLNVLVIYDAYAGPLFHVSGASGGRLEEGAAA